MSRELDDVGKEELEIEEELDAEEQKIKRREERYKAQVEKIIANLRSREKPITFTKERMAIIKGFVEEKNPVLHAENYFAKRIKGMIIFKRLIALSTISVTNPINTLVIGDPSCLVADERVALADGRIVKIGEMGEHHLQRIDYELYLGKGWTMGRAVRFHKYKNQPVIEIATESGKTLKGTPNQPVLIQGKENDRSTYGWKRLDQLKVGDKVRVTTRIPCAIADYAKTGWKKPQFYHKSKHTKTPEVVDEKLGGLIGYLLAEGWSRRHYEVGCLINSEEQDLIPKLKRYFADLFNAPIHLTTMEPTHEAGHIHGEKFYRLNPITELRVYRRSVAEWLEIINEKRVPQMIFDSLNSVVASCLSWLFEGDGCVFSKGRGRRAIQLKVGKGRLELARDVQMLLLRFKIHSRLLIWKGTGNLVIRRGYDIIRFAEQIGFQSKKKKEKLKEAVANAKSHARTKGQLSERIVSIKRLGRQTVYDIEAPPLHRFVANGIICHNTGKSEIGLAYQEVTPNTSYAWGSKLTQAGMTITTLGRKISLGMLPRCHFGHVMIDEFNRISPEDTGAVLAMMQHGFFGVEKAWLKVERVPARAPITAMANPFPEYFKGTSVAQIKSQIPIQSSALLTRFHFILVILRPSVEEFAEITDHQIRSKRLGTPMCTFDDFEKKVWRDFVEYQRRQTIFAWAHPQRFQRMIKAFVTECYRQDLKLKRLAIPISPRMTEGMMATCENMAKAQMRTIVTNADVARSVKLLAYALEPSGLDVNSAFKKVKEATGIDLS